MRSVAAPWHTRRPGAGIIGSSPRCGPAVPGRAPRAGDIAPDRAQAQAETRSCVAAAWPPNPSSRRHRKSAFRLAQAHVDLAKAEFSAIGGQIARAPALGGIAFAVVLLAGILLVVGTSLFIAEWLFGSMGWGIVHGVLVLAGVATACRLAIVGMSGGRIGRSFSWRS